MLVVHSEKTTLRKARLGVEEMHDASPRIAAIHFWQRLGFTRDGGEALYVIMTGWGCEVHLTRADSSPWRVPEEHNPFGIFIRTPEVDAIAARVDDLIIRPGGLLRHREWGLYEVESQGRTACLSAPAGPLGSCTNLTLAARIRTWES